MPKFISTKILVCYFLLGSFWVCAQVPKKEVDSVKLSYEKIENYSKKSKFTSFLHKLIFKSTEVKPKQNLKKSKTEKHQNFEGKIIRKIHIKTLDPFGFSETDTSKNPKRFLSKFGNQIHIKTQNFAIKNLLLIHPNDSYDSLLVKESERLIRSQRFVRRVAFRTQPIAENSDSLDIYINVLDSWSLIPNATFTPSRATYELTERNFLGMGHTWDNTFRQNLDDKKNAYSTSYRIPNIKNTYITAGVNYNIDLLNNYTKSVAIERPFFSPFARWAGGVLAESKFRRDSLPDSESNYAMQNFKTGTVELWGGFSTQINKGKTEVDRITNLITTVRFLNVNYLEQPDMLYDPEMFFSSEKFWLTGIGISSRKFVQEQYVFNFGIPEDIPIGKYYGITGGYQVKNNTSRTYFGVRATLGNYFKWGYFSTNYEYGTFFNNNKSEQSAWVTQINYFTPLMELGKWKVRQFFKSNIILGSNRIDSEGDFLSINEDAGIQGFNVPKFLGTKKMVFSFQTQSYSPWNWAGFRMSPFFNYSLAFLGNSDFGFTKSQGYSKIGIGMILTNDYLVFNSFQISLSFFPKIPLQGENIFQTNSFKTSDFGYLDFEINKPRVATYQ
ncbi:hypothetical protein [Flavobacterium sp.]|uniref:hypothetical protein n=1 Tax=Flavobacterium sp. TaxID=239 RepID=UPI002FD94EE1